MPLLAAMLIAALPLAEATPYEHCIVRDHRGRIARSNTARHAFARAQACPSTGQHRLPCPGYRIDHIVPLKRCGVDAPENMQWLTIEQWREKTRWE